MMELLFGYALGSAMNSGNSSPGRVSQSQAGEVYVNPRVIQRVKDPLEVLTSCTGNLEFRETKEMDGYNRDVSTRGSFSDFFEMVQPGNTGKYEILRIVRVLDGKSARFWFEYISKDGLQAETPQDV